ncbi:SRPBCC family protein [Rhabdothermincola sp.]|uniref:SRPBCC family protein n=1 Tax=Rhabdothermincola sp. TaxID=2820405 RepID=UPI002FE38D89
MSRSKRQVSVSRVIAAPPEKIFDVLADPSKHPIIDGSGTVKRARGSAPRRLELGSTFGMDMRMGVPYVIKNTVVEFEPNRLIAWRHLGRHRWRFELEPVEGGTRVTETFDWSTALAPWMIELVGYPKRHPANMLATLERLDAYVTTGEVPAS